MNPTTEPTILALDAAGNACSVTLWAAGEVVARRWESMARGHAEALMPMAEAVVADRGFAAIDRVAVSVGPGAYTGLRIAVSAARGLGLALGVPVQGIGSFGVHRRIARDGDVAGPLAVVLETKRSDFYLQIFGIDDAALTDPAVLDTDEVARALREHSIETVVGDAADRLAAEIPGAGLLAMCAQEADAAIVAALAAGLPAPADAPPPRPMYLRPPDTSPPGADRQRLRG